LVLFYDCLKGALTAPFSLLMDPAFFILVAGILFFCFALAVTEAVAYPQQGVPVDLEVGVLLPYLVNGSSNCRRATPENIVHHK
jgi:hypothetical protein